MYKAFIRTILCGKGLIAAYLCSIHSCQWNSSIISHKWIWKQVLHCGRHKCLIVGRYSPSNTRAHLWEGTLQKRLAKTVWIAHWPKHSSVYSSLPSWELFFPRCKRKSLMFLPPSITRVSVGLKMNHKYLIRFPGSCKYINIKKGTITTNKPNESVIWQV